MFIENFPNFLLTLLFLPVRFLILLVPRTINKFSMFGVLSNPLIFLLVNPS